jgi:hypothetical protein
VEHSGGAVLAGITAMTLSRLALCQYKHRNVKRGGAGQVGVAFKPMKNKYIFVSVIACCFWSVGFGYCESAAAEVHGRPDELMWQQ